MNCELKKIEGLIKDCEKDIVLDPKIKRIRLGILFSYLTILERKKERKELIDSYMDLGALLSESSSGEVYLSQNLEEALKVIKAYIKDSDIVQLVEQRDGMKYDFVSLKNVIFPYKKIMVESFNNICIAIELYGVLFKLIDNVRSSALFIQKSLESLLGLDLLSKCYDEYIIDNSKNRIINRKNKSIAEYNDNKKKAIETLYNFQSKGIISIDIYNCSKDMIDALFDYYINGLPKIPINNYVNVEGIELKKI